MEKYFIEHRYQNDLFSLDIILNGCVRLMTVSIVDTHGAIESMISSVDCMVKIPTRTHVRDTFDSHERLHGRDRRAPLAPDYLPMETGVRVELSRTCVRVYFCYTRSYETI